MNRSSKKYRLNPTTPQQTASLNTRQFLKMSSTLLKDFLNKNQQSFLQSRTRRYYPVNKGLDSTAASSNIVDVSAEVSNKMETDGFEPAVIQDVSPAGGKQRKSHRILENRNLRQNQQKDTGLYSISKQKTAQQPMKVPNPRNHEHKVSQKKDQQSLNRSNIFKRRVNGSIEHKTSGVASYCNIFQSSQYYINDLKSSTIEFIKNQEYNSAHLSHLMESLSTFKMFSYSYLPKHPHKVVNLPPIPSQKITLVFDLDQTLLHTQVVDWETDQQTVDWGQIVQIEAADINYRVNLKIRPHAVEVLNRLKQHFEIGVCTAGQQHYASRLIKRLDPEDNIFSFKLYRHHCLEMHSRVSYVKDLRVLGNRELSRVVLIDNAPQSYLFQKSNGVPIISFYDDNQDKQLLKLQSFLMNLLKVEDVRPALGEYFKLEKYSKYNSVGKLVEDLY